MIFFLSFEIKKNRTIVEIIRASSTPLEYDRIVANNVPVKQTESKSFRYVFFSLLRNKMERKTVKRATIALELIGALSAGINLADMG
jgi:hypothetical protein